MSILAVLIVLLLVISIHAQNVTIQFWCGAVSACTGTFTTLTAPLNTCARQRDPCQGALSASMLLTRCTDGLVFSFNINLGSSSCSGTDTYQFLLDCDKCNSFTVNNRLTYHAEPLCSGIAPSGSCPTNLVTIPPSLPPSLSPLPTLPPPSSPPSTPSPTSRPPLPSVAPSNTTGPRALGPALYTAKNGQLVNAQVSLVEYFVEFDQELHSLDFGACEGSQSCLPLPQCYGCDYTNPGGLNCGNSPSGPACRTAVCDGYLSYVLCSPDFAESLVTLEFGKPLFSQLNINLGYARGFAIYIPPVLCGTLRVSVTTNYGADSLYVVLMDAESIIEAFSQDSRLKIKWDSHTQFLDICPGDPNYPKGGETMFILVSVPSRVFRSFVTNFTILFEELPPASPLVPLPTLPPAPPGITQLNNEGNILLTFPSETQLQNFSINLTGPCPRYFGASVKLPLGVETWVSLIAFDTSVQDPIYWTDTGIGESRLVFSFCPPNSSDPVILNIAVSSASPSGRFFYTTDPNKFRVVPMIPPSLVAPFASSRSIATAMLPSVYVRCDSTTFSPQPAAGALGPAYLITLPPSWSSPPTWPLFSNVVRDGDARISFPPPVQYLSISTPTPPSAYSPTLLHFATNILIHQPGSDASAWEALWLLPNETDGCTIRPSPGLVNAFGMPADPTPIPVQPRAISCSVQDFRDTKALIDSLIASLDPNYDSTTSNSLTAAQLDAIEFSDPWQACVLATEASFSLREQGLVSVDSSTVCTTPKANTTCCDPGTLLSYGPCVGVRGDVIQTNRTLSDEMDECLFEYLKDYDNLADANCVDTVPYAMDWYLRQTLPFARCYGASFGTYGDGEACEVDADCPSLPDFAAWCDKGTKRCVRAIEAGYLQFMSCLLNATSPPVLRALYSRFNLSSIPPTPEELMQASADKWPFGDCAARHGTDLQRFQTHLGWKYRDESPSENQYCPTVPLSLSVVSTLPPCMADLHLDQLTPDPFAAFNAEICGFIAVSNRICNWNNSNSEDPALCLAHGSFCALCYNDSYCMEFPETKSMNMTQCNSAALCQIQNGSYVILHGTDQAALKRQCSAILSCSQPCWDRATGLSRPCKDLTECVNTGGSCLGDADLYHFENGTKRVPGACLLSIKADFPCGITYAHYNNTQMTSLPYGCALHWNTSRASCAALNKTDNVTRWALPAQNEAECKAHGSACTRGPIVGFDGQSWPTWSATLIMPPLMNGTAQCWNCAGGMCTDYCTWQGARWLPGELRPLTWQDPKFESPVAFIQDAFVLSALAGDIEIAAQSAYQTYAISSQNCRFNRLASALEASSCAVAYANDSAALRACLDQVPQNLPVAYGYVCQGELFSLLVPTSNAVPALLSFPRNSTAACPLQCSAISILDVSSERFAAARPPIRLSSYWTPKAKGPPAGSKSFANEHRAIVGQVVGGGLSILLPSCSVFASVEVCFPLPTYRLENARYTEKDIAIADPSLSFLTPLEIYVQPNEAQGTWCAKLPLLRNNSVYAPILRLASWADVRPGDLSRGAVASLAFTATGCALVTALALAAVVALILRRPTDFFMLVPFYLLLLIAASTLIRAIYFASLASNHNSGSGSNARDVVLIELPTFLWFTAVTLIISFWVVLSQSRLHASGVLARVAVIFTIANVIMYSLLIATIVAFAKLNGSKIQCNGRLSATNERHKQHIVQVFYQALLAIVATLIGIAFGFVAIRYVRASQSEPSKQLRNATYIATIIAASFVLHAIYLLVLAITSPGIPELALLILITEALPAGIIVIQMLHRYLSINFGTLTGSATTDEVSERAQYYSHSDDDGAM